MSIEQKYFDDYQRVIGCDEVGRGPIAGPVNACSVSVDKRNFFLIDQFWQLGVTDSKKLTPKKRRLLLEQLDIDVAKLKTNILYTKQWQQGEFSFVVAEASPERIDKINILQASLECMQKSSDKLCSEKTAVLVDGNKTFITKAQEIEAIVKGDSKVALIGLASIIAKEYRDYLMLQLHQTYPGYGLAKNAGYPTGEHKLAVKELGVTPIHRKTFKGVKEYLA